LLALAVGWIADFSEPLGGLPPRPAGGAAAKTLCQDFLQKRFGFYSKDTASEDVFDFGRLWPRPACGGARHYLIISKSFLFALRAKAKRFCYFLKKC